MIKFQHVIVVTGTPGVGKTRVSEALTEKLNGLHISLNDIAKKERLVLCRDAERDTVVVDLERLSDRVAEIISNTNVDVIVDGHYASDVVSPDVVSKVFVLRIDPDKLRERLRGRGYDKRKVMENLASEILDVCLYDAIGRYGSERVAEIEVTDKSIEDVVEEIIDILKGRREAEIGKIDWLGKLDREDRLSEFFCHP